MFMYLNHKNFNINKDHLELESRDNIVVVCIISKNCKFCSITTDTLSEFADIYKNVNFAIVNIDIQCQLVDTLKNCGISITKVPTFLLFKIGIFERELNFCNTIITKESFRKELLYELDPLPILPKNHCRNRYSYLN